MPTSTDLLGLGMAPQLGALLGNQDSTVTCAGSTNATATLIKTHMPKLVASGGATGAIFNSSSSIGSPYFTFCSSSTSALVYPPSGQTMNGATDGTVTVAQNKMCIFIQYNKGNWSSLLTA